MEWILLSGCAVLFALVAIPNFITALDRARQKETMAAERDWGLALESSPEFQRRYRSNPGAALHSLARSRKLSLRDAWGNPFRIIVTDRWYSVHSGGRDGRFERVVAYGTARTLDEDIVFSNGGFVRFPEGI